MKTIIVTGVLVIGRVYIGGEGTGWELRTDDSGTIEVDVDQVKSQAERFKGKRVTITGYYITKGYIERGPIETLVAEQISLVA